MRLIWLPCLSLCTLLIGCPSTEQAPGADNPWASPPGGAPSAPTIAPGGGPDAGQPPPVAAEGGPAQPVADGGCQPAAYARESHPSGGETVTISGSLTVESSNSQGSLLIELVKPEDRVATYGFACPVMSTFSLEVPAELGEVGVVALIDGNDNGPDGADAAGRVAGTITIKADDIAELEITITAEPDLGELKPPYRTPNIAAQDEPQDQPPEGEIVLPEGDNEVTPIEGSQAGGEPPGEVSEPQ